eukprot:9463974-Heterocapsa_arctica.AAC.1
MRDGILAQDILSYRFIPPPPLRPHAVLLPHRVGEEGVLRTARAGAGRHPAGPGRAAPRANRRGTSRP